MTDFDTLLKENEGNFDQTVKQFVKSKKERKKFLSGGAVGVGSKKIGGVGTAVDNQVGTFQSILSGIGAGLIDIPKGAFSLGASLLDLGLGTNSAAQVESFFDNLTTFDEKAEATTAGKITRILTNLGIPGTAAFRTASGLAQKAMTASKKGNYFHLSRKLDGSYEKTLTNKGRLFSTLAGAGGVGGGSIAGTRHRKRSQQ